MKTLTSVILLLSSLFMSANLCAQTKTLRYNEPSLGVSMADGEIQITWTTSREVNSSYFLIETSADSIHFTTLKTVPAAGSSIWGGIYQDFDIASDSLMYFRITLVDMNETRLSSGVVSIYSSGPSVAISK